MYPITEDTLHDGPPHPSNEVRARGERKRGERERRERGERESGERERERETPGYEPFALDVSGASLRPSNEVPSFTYRGTSLIRNCFLLGPYPSNEVPSRGENLY